MANRRLILHSSGLSDAEYDFYTESLLDIALPNESAAESTEPENLSVSVREARAWFRGRFPSLKVLDIDTVS
jgi:hypothetical protein